MSPSPSPSLPTIARVAIGLELLLGVGALVGGGALMLAPDGGLLRIPPSLLEGSPFHSFLWPGVILFTVLGVAPIGVAWLSVQRRAFAPMAAIAVGTALVVWITVEMVMLSGAGSLAWAFYLVLGTSLAAVGLGWHRSAPPAKAQGDVGQTTLRRSSTPTTPAAARPASTPRA
jgi:hypothetical protein